MKAKRLLTRILFISLVIGIAGGMGLAQGPEPQASGAPHIEWIPPWWFSPLAGLVSGGLMGALVNRVFIWRNAQQAEERKEKGIIASLVGELRHARALCDLNAGLPKRAPETFIRLPTAVALRATFEERHSYPRIAELHQDLEAYIMSASHVNQLMELHDLICSSGVWVKGRGEYDRSMERISSLCAGELKLEGFGPEKFIYLPKFIEHVLSKLERVMQGAPRVGRMRMR